MNFDDEAVGIGKGDRSGAEIEELLDGVLGHVAAARDEAGLPGERLAAGRQHLLGEIDAAVAGRLGTDQRAAPVEPLAGEDAGELVAQPLVLPEEIADLAPSDPDVPGRHVGVRADVAKELAHEALAEAHHLVVALPLGIEVRAPLAAAHRQGGQRVLEHLLEGQELEDAEVDRGVEPQAALVGADGAVHLDAEATVDADVPRVVLPGDAEHEDPLGLDDPLEDLGVGVLGMPFEDESQRFGDLLDRLMELRLGRVLGLHLRQQRRHVLGHGNDLSSVDVGAFRRPILYHKVVFPLHPLPPET